MVMLNSTLKINWPINNPNISLVSSTLSVFMLASPKTSAQTTGIGTPCKIIKRTIIQMNATIPLIAGNIKNVDFHTYNPQMIALIP